MNELILKRHKGKFFLQIWFAFFFLILISVLLSIMFYDLYKKESLGEIVYVIPLFSIVGFIIAFYFVKQSYRNIPRITIELDRIYYGREEVISKNEVENVVLTGKVPYKFFNLHIPAEGIDIQLKSGKSIFIYDDYYSNISQGKFLLKKHFVEFPDTKVTPTEIKPNNQINSPLKVFKGSQLKSSVGLWLWGTILFFFVFVILTHNIFGMFSIIFFSGFSIIIFLMYSWQMHYFIFNRDLFIISNHNLPWINRSYKLNEISEIVVEIPNPRLPHSLRIISKDYKNKVYPAGTLKKDDWLNLMKRFETYNIIVRNESLYE